MKKLVIKLVIYIVLLTAIILTYNACYLHLSTNKFSANVPDDIQLCNFGSSHGRRAFNYEDFKTRYVCSNFALTSQSILYDYRILQHYKDKIKSGAYVFIVASYFSFFGRPEAEDTSFLSQNKRYYKLLPPDLILNYDWKTNMYINALPALSVESLTELLYNLLLRKEIEVSGERFNDFDEAYLHLATTSNDASIDAVKAYRRHIASRIDADGRRICKKEAFDSIYPMIKLCREIGAKPILVTVPFTRDYTDIIRKNDPNFFREFYSVIDEIRQKTGIEYYDYGFDERFRNDYSLFMNSDHMNRKGARMFTRILLREVLGITPD